METACKLASVSGALCWEISGWSLIPQSTFHCFLNWHDNAHTKHETFVENQFICYHCVDNISVSFSKLPAVENGPYRACTMKIQRIKMPYVSFATLGFKSKSPFQTRRQTQKSGTSLLRTRHLKKKRSSSQEITLFWARLQRLEFVFRTIKRKHLQVMYLHTCGLF